MQLDEPVRRRDRRGDVLVLVICIRDFELRLLRVAAVRIARLELLVELDGFFVIAIVQVGLGFRVQLVRRPALGFIVIHRRQQAAACQAQHQN